MFFGFNSLPTNGDKIQLPGAELMGVPTLTSLALEHNNIRVEFLECIITVNQEKNIVTTPLQGRDGTIKEYISDGDYTFTVDAAVSSYKINQNGDADNLQSQEYPKSQIEDVLAMLKIKETLNLQSDFLTMFGIHNAVVKAYSVVQETHSNRQAFQIQMLSDTAYEIKIQQDVATNK
jgi:hypothetical protein